MATDPTNPPTEQASLDILKEHALFVGLTGGIGSGKTAVSDRLAQLGAGVVDTDLIAHQITTSNGAAIPFIQKQFGAEFIDSSGALDRPKMRKLVFADPDARKALEAITHPLIRKETIKQAKKLIEDKVPYLVFVVPLLIESGNWLALLDYLVVVDCPEEVQIERVMHRSNLPRPEVERILKAQASRQERINHADMVIENQGSLDSLQAEVLKLHQKNLKDSERSHKFVIEYGLVIVYEYPFNELVRSMLRLEYLFARFSHFVRSDDPELHHNAISILFDLGDIGARGDIKSLLLKEFERQKYALNGLKSSQKVDQEALTQTLSEIDAVASSINQSAGRPNSAITESEWLNAIRTRLNIPGGTSPIDLPSYHAWKNSPTSERRELLEKYINPLLPWHEACQLFLRLLRQSGEAKDVVAHNGSFQQAPSGKVYQLMRIAVEDDTLFSEISANKYLLSVRFLKSDRDKKAQLVNADVPFKLTLCQL